MQTRWDGIHQHIPFVSESSQSQGAMDGNGTNQETDFDPEKESNLNEETSIESNCAKETKENETENSAMGDAGDSSDQQKEVLEPENKSMPPTKKMEALEIEIGRQVSDNELNDLAMGREAPETPSFDEDDEGFNDMESLLGGGATKRKTTSGSVEDSKQPWCGCCRTKAEMTMGNVKVPSLYVYGYTGGWGVVGPHWFGPPCVFGIILVATYYFAYHQCFRKHWYWTSAFCFYLSMQTTYFLMSAAYRDPGVVREGRLNVPDPVPRNFRWCESCNYYQPPTTLHCPDCNTCVLGFDHHCVWMGNCIGVGKASLRYCLL